MERKNTRRSNNTQGNIETDMKRAIIVHGWGGTPNSGWKPWLKKELEAKNFFVELPVMPNTDTPTIDAWVKHLAKFVDEEDDNYLIGHSMGCQAILRYLENKPAEVKVKGAVLVAGFITSLSDAIMKNPEDAPIATPWLETPIDLEKIKLNAGKIISIVSDDDPYIPGDNWKKFEELGRLIVLHKKGHIQEIEPAILKEVLSLVQ